MAAHFSSFLLICLFTLLFFPLNLVRMSAIYKMEVDALPKWVFNTSSYIINKWAKATTYLPWTDKAYKWKKGRATLYLHKLKWQKQVFARTKEHESFHWLYSVEKEWREPWLQNSKWQTSDIQSSDKAKISLK